MPSESEHARHRAAYENAQREWPKVHVAFEDFRAHVNQCEESNSTNRSLAEGDLFLALALSHRDAGAIEQFELVIAPHVRGLLRRRNVAADLVDDHLQSLRVQLFLGPTPSILSYAGRGPLRSWVSVTAIRDAMKVWRTWDRQAELDLHIQDGLRADTVVDDDMMKAAYRETFRKAFANAIEELSPRERTLLRLNGLDGLSIDELGAFYQVHRSTIARRLDRARAKVRRSTRLQMAAEFAQHGDDVDAIFGMIESQLDASIHRVLVSSAPK